MRTAGLFTIILLLFASTLFPQTINYQGYLKNGSGTPVNTQVSVTSSL